MIEHLHCPLCGSSEAGEYHRDGRRSYLQCQRCQLVFVPPRYHLTTALEKAEYDLHQNAVDDAGYRRFLSRLAQPLLERIPPAARGLDFGCGPGPALAAMLEEEGCTMSLYDIFYFPDTAVLQVQYPFVTATEVVEHLREPRAVLQALWQLLEPGGYLGVMTKLVRDAQAFAHWHYKNDPTHIVFFSEYTWQWWAQQVGAELERVGADVILLHKPSAA